MLFVMTKQPINICNKPVFYASDSKSVKQVLKEFDADRNGMLSCRLAENIRYLQSKYIFIDFQSDFTEKMCILTFSTLPLNSPMPCDGKHVIRLV